MRARPCSRGSSIPASCASLSSPWSLSSDGTTSDVSGARSAPHHCVRAIRITYHTSAMRLHAVCAGGGLGAIEASSNV